MTKWIRRIQEWYSPLKDFWSNYRKLAWVELETMTTKFRSDALTDWAIRPWVQVVLRANFVQLLQFHLFVQCSHFNSAIAFVSRHICFKRNLAQVITLVARERCANRLKLRTKPHFISLVSIYLWFSDVFSGYRKRSVRWNGLAKWFWWLAMYQIDWKTIRVSLLT